MNLHPILVHFPIAILTIYAILELLRFRRLQAIAGWWHAKAYTAVVGTLGAYAAYLAGDESGELSTDLMFRKVFDLHETWATITLVIFTIIAVHYLIELVRRNPKMAGLFMGSSLRIRIAKLLLQLSALIGQPVLLSFLAFAGLCAITITGGLGGSMVYGPDVDPVVSLIYKFLVN